MADLAGARDELTRRGVTVVLVHPGSDEQADRLAAEFPASREYHWHSDPAGGLYREFGLGRAALGTAFSPRVWRRGAAAFGRGHRPTGIIGDPSLLSGTFVLRQGRVVTASRHTDPSDRDDFLAMLGGPS